MLGIFDRELGILDHLGFLRHELEIFDLELGIFDQLGFL